MVGGRRGRHAPHLYGALALLRPWMGVLHVMIHGGGASALHLMCTAAISCIVFLCSAVWGLVCDGSARGGAVRVQRKKSHPANPVPSLVLAAAYASAEGIPAVAPCLHVQTTYTGICW